MQKFNKFKREKQTYVLTRDNVWISKWSNTPTSTGPNSYGKTNMGFVDQRKLFEKKLKEKADKLLHEDENWIE